jgi:hypothetical protein
MLSNTAIGTKLLIEVESDGTRFISFLVGYSKDKFILITTPSSDNLFSARPTLFADYKINVRYIEDGRAFGFQAKLLKTIEEPTRLMFLSYPTHIEDRELRAGKRATCALPAESSMMGLVCKAVIVDINQLGLRFHVKEADFTLSLDPSSVGQECTLRFFLPGESDQKEILGEIRNYEHNNQHLAFGIKFTKISDSDKQKIIEFESKVFL